MKKNEFPNKDFTIQYKDYSEFLALFTRVYDEQRDPKKIAEFERELEKHIGIENKIKFCKDFKEYYHNTLPCEVSIVSGKAFVFDMYPKGTALFFDNIIDKKIERLEAELNTQKNIGNRKEYSLNEIALSYIFELYAKGMQIPQSPQGNAKNKITEIGNSEYGVNGKSLYKYILKIKGLNLNNHAILNGLSARWYDAVKEICTKRNTWETVYTYLKPKKIIDAYLKAKKSEGS